MQLSALLQLEADGHLEQLQKSGFVSPKLYRYLYIFLHVARKCNNEGLTKNEAVMQSETELGLDERTIWRALKSIQHN